MSTRFFASSCCFVLLSLAACSNADIDDVDSSEGAVTDERALSYVGEAVVAKLDADFGREKGSLWNVARDGKLSGDFVVQFPPRSTWGTTDAPSAPRCKATDAGCDKDFLLKECSSDDACETHRCVALKATIAKQGDAPKKLCIGHSETNLDKVWETIAHAKHIVDITSLSVPEERFAAAIANALAYASGTTPPPRVRMLFGDYPSAGNAGDAQVGLKRLASKIPASSPMEVNVATYRARFAVAGKTTWNHSKIVSADGNHALVGGANMWDLHYLRKNPVHDLWIELEGSPAADASRFVDRLFKFACVDQGILDLADKASRRGPKCPAPFGNGPTGVASSGGTSPVISVGRMGTIGPLASDAALIAMIDAAKSEVRLSQQDLGPVHLSNLNFGTWPDALVGALVRAMGRGVEVHITLSNTGAYPDELGRIEQLYNSYDNGWTEQQVAQKFVEMARQNPWVLPSGTTPEELVCGKLLLMRLRMSDAPKWPSGGTFANHAKVIEVDRRAFYVGSQNAYSAPLAEFGYIVDDEEATKAFDKSYLDNVERWSRPTAISGPGVACRI